MKTASLFVNKILKTSGGVILPFHTETPGAGRGFLLEQISDKKCLEYGVIGARASIPWSLRYRLKYPRLSAFSGIF